MDREEIIRMALEAGLPGAGDHDFRGGFDKMTRPEQDALQAIEYFAELVAAKERKACAQLCEGMHEEDRPGDYAYAIRARGATDGK